MIIRLVTIGNANLHPRMMSPHVESSQNVVCDNVRPDGNGYTVIHQLYADGRTVFEDEEGRLTARAVAAARQHDRFAPTDGQAQFNLTRTPADDPQVFLNGMIQDSVAFSVFARTLTWLMSDNISLSSGDILNVYYDFVP